MPSHLHSRHNVSLLTVHLVWSPKYRSPILTGPVSRDCERIIREVCDDTGVMVLELAVARDHVHLYMQFPPTLALGDIVRRIKGRTSHDLRRDHPHLREWCPSVLWSPSYYIRSIGSGEEAVHEYIRRQRQDAAAVHG